MGAAKPRTQWTEVPYLFVNGVRLARVVYNDSSPEIGANETHVFLEIGDHLGSTSVVIDRATGELVERGTYQAYGAAESDYRPDRWQEFREDYRFTGKEEDVQVGLTYFGKRFLSPYLNRWVSADPLEIHEPGESGDLNVYAYVSGQALKAVDPQGLFGASACEKNQPAHAKIDAGAPKVAAPADSGPSSGGPERTEPKAAPTQLPGGVRSEAGETYEYDPVATADELEANGFHDALDTGIATGIVAGSMLPGGGEGMDVATIADPTATALDKVASAASLGASFLSVGFLPNYGSIRAALRVGHREMEAVEGVAHMRSPSTAAHTAADRLPMPQAAKKVVTKADTRGGRGRIKTGDDALEQVNGIEGHRGKLPPKHRAEEGQKTKDAIRSTSKSKQRLDEKLRKYDPEDWE